MHWELVIQFFILTAIVSGAIIFTLHRVFVAGTEGAKQRLDRDAEAARAKEAELSRKIKQTDEELAARKHDLKLLEQKMQGDMEAEATKYREELVNKVRLEAEEIISKGQAAAEGLRRDIEKQMDLKIIDYSVKIMQEVLSKKTKAAFEKDLIEEFILQLKQVDMSKISPDIKSANVVTACGISDADLKRISDIVRSQTGRDILFTPKTDDTYIAGVVIQFGSLMLDGSVRNAVKESALALKAEVEKAYLKTNSKA
jgi:F0F1-type ATP synthase delta subunit